MVAGGTHVNGQWCFDYGNAEATIADTGNGHMDAVYLGLHCHDAPCTGSGPWVAADLENGLYQGSGNNPANLGNPTPFVTALLKNDEQARFALKGGNATSGGLSTWWNGALPAGGDTPIHQEGSIVLGTGGDNSNGSVGSCFEGVMTAGYPADAADAAANGTKVQLWDCAGAGGPVWQQAGTSLKNPQSGRCLDAPSGATANGTRLQIWDCNGSAAQTFTLS